MKGRVRAAPAFLVLGLLAGCDSGERLVTYVCEEPLDRHLELARDNIARGYEVERSRRILTQCADKTYHRRYTFSFEPRAMASRQASEASVRADWCGSADARTAAAELTTTSAFLTFRFDYPWATPTGKYPRTEFRLNRNTMMGGFFDDMRWTCQLEQDSIAPG